jgi:hypothetical protein
MTLTSANNTFHTFNRGGRAMSEQHNRIPVRPPPLSVAAPHGEPLPHDQSTHSIEGDKP